MVDSVQASYITGIVVQGILFIFAFIIWILKFSGVFGSIGLPKFKKWYTKISFTIAIFVALLAELALYIVLVLDTTSTVERGDGVMVVWVRWAFYIIILTAGGYAYMSYFWFDKIEANKKRRDSSMWDFLVRKTASVVTPVSNALIFTMLLIAALIDNSGRWAPFAIAALAWIVSLIITGYLTFQLVPVKYTKVGTFVKFLVLLIAFVLWGAYIAIWAISDVGEDIISFTVQSWIFFALNVVHSIFLIMLIFTITGPPEKLFKKKGEKEPVLSEKKFRVKNTRNHKKKKNQNPLDDLTAEDLF